MQTESCWQNSGKSPSYVENQYWKAQEVELTETYNHVVHIQNITETNKRSTTGLSMLLLTEF